MGLRFELSLPRGWAGGEADFALLENAEEESITATLTDPARGSAPLVTSKQLYGVALEREKQWEKQCFEQELREYRARGHERAAKWAAYSSDTTFVGRRRLLGAALASIEGEWLYAVQLLRETRGALLNKLLQFKDASTFGLWEDRSASSSRKPEVCRRAAELRTEVGSVDIKLTGEVQGAPRHRVVPTFLYFEVDEAYAELDELGGAVETFLKSVKKRGVELVGLRKDAERALHACAHLTQEQQAHLWGDLHRFRETAKGMVVGIVAKHTHSHTQKCFLSTIPGPPPPPPVLTHASAAICAGAASRRIA
jgi:hypothetical protein